MLASILEEFRLNAQVAATSMKCQLKNLDTLANDRIEDKL
jgi:hypothetical protein